MFSTVFASISFAAVLIVAKCNVNNSLASSSVIPKFVLIVAKCNVNRFKCSGETERDRY